MRRSNNQDAHTVVLASDMDHWKKRGHFFMVADGMGAHAAGELASGLAVEGVPHLYHKYSDLSPPEALQKAIYETNSAVHRKGEENADFRNMGTTASALILLPQGAIAAHIGDSRIYRLREGKIEQLTFDHSLVWELRAAGQLSDDAELAQAIPKNVITRSLGPNASVHADIEGPIRMKVGDTFLLCSDGLTGRIEDDEIAAILTFLPLDDAGHMLVDLANLRGGPDNITVVLVKITDAELETPKEQDDPIKIGSAEAKAIHPAIWACAATCWLGASVLTYTRNGVLAIVAFVGGLAALIVGLVSRVRSYSPGVALGTGRRLGKGPYARAVCPPSQVIADRFLTIATDLRNSSASSGANSKLNWSDFDLHCQEARKQMDSGKSIAAIQSVAKAMRALMQSIRDHQNKQAEDSNIDL
jgi:serine/threonine protein phosphatase PrpC